MNSLLAHRRRVAQIVGRAWEAHEHVTAILVFGSVASGRVDARSDVDMLLVCHPAILTVAERQRLLPAIGTGWIFGDTTESGLFSVEDRAGVVDGIRVEIHYHSAAWLDAIVQQVVEQGAMTTPQQSFRPYTLIALLQRAWILFDREDRIAGWRERAMLYPHALKQNILRHFVPILEEETADMVASVERRIGPMVVLFHLNRAVDAMCSILYAMNGIYDPADRRAGQLVLPFLDHAPDRFMPRLTEILEGPFTQEGMNVVAQRFMQLCEEVIASAKKA
jgi:predicted nucleotidyltransferase